MSFLANISPSFINGAYFGAGFISVLGAFVALSESFDFLRNRKRVKVTEKFCMFDKSSDELKFTPEFVKFLKETHCTFTKDQVTNQVLNASIE